MVQLDEWTTLSDALGRMNTRSKKSEQIPGITTGLRRLDDFVGGFRPGSVTLLGGRPCMGSTVFSLNSARVAAVDRGIPVGVIKLEKNDGYIAEILLGQVSGIHRHLIRTGKLTDNEAESIAVHSVNFARSPLFIRDAGSGSRGSIKKAITCIQEDRGVKLVVIDYMQLILDDTGAKISDYGKCVKDLKVLAQQLDIAIVIELMLPTSVDERTYDRCRPRLTDLCVYGDIAQSADLVLFLYREEVYEQDEDAKARLLGHADVTIAKNRYGATGMVMFTFLKDCGRFVDV